MALLLYWWTRCKEQNCRLEFDHCPEKLRQIAVVSGLESVFLDASPLE
jgi:ABC-type transporter Mla MlaB component